MAWEYTRRGVLRAVGATGLVGVAQGARDARGDDPEYPSRAWLERELRNYAKTQEAPAEQATSGFLAAWQARSGRNAADYLDRTFAEPGWRSHGNACAQYAEQCTGDPRLYPDVDDFYGEVGVRERVAFHDREGARLSAHVWAPADASTSDRLPGVVITNGSVQAPETVYWWFAQTLVRAGYVVLTYDPRGQGRSDTTTPDGEPGTDARPPVFVENQVDAIDFFHATPAQSYPHNPDGVGDAAAPVRNYNPFHEVLDRSRLGVVGHSLGATGVSVVQGLDPWPGALPRNPVGAAVAWDDLAAEWQETGYEITPRVPAMGQSADYGLVPRPKERPPDDGGKLDGFEAWRAAGVDAYEVVVRGGTHYEWSRVPTFPATSWSFGNDLADHYSLAWLDRWLKRPDEPGYDDAVDRLLADDTYASRLSFYYRSARDFRGREGSRHVSRDVRGDADAPDGETLLSAVAGSLPAADQSSSGP
jgi:hypothetical protein